MTDRDYQHSRILDVHRWSEHQEANLFVDEVYDTFLNRQEPENTSIKKKHLKVILLDLYVAWLNDPDLNIAVHMSPAAYSNGTVFSSGKSRYNELNIKVSTIDIVHRLDEAGLIGRKDGWQDSGGKGFLTRIWPTPKLTKLFEDAAFGFFDIGYADNRETIILRDEDKVDAPYDDTRMVRDMRQLLQDYNKLLEKTFIDIQSLDVPRIELPEKKKRRQSNKQVFVNITHHDKFVRRIFNNETFNDGGRFYGGWWQRIDSKFRKEIRLNDSPTVEIDYSALHVILAYAEANIDYWQTTNKDPYDLPVRGVNNPEHCRDIAKLFLLLSLNASDEKRLYRAFRSELNYREYPYSFPDVVLSELLDTIKEHHSARGRLHNRPVDSRQQGLYLFEAQLTVKRTNNASGPGIRILQEALNREPQVTLIRTFHRTSEESFVSQPSSLTEETKGEIALNHFTRVSLILLFNKLEKIGNHFNDRSTNRSKGLRRLDAQPEIVAPQ